MEGYALQHASARDLEKTLGDPFGNGLFSYEKRVAEDERELYPLEALRALDSWGMQRHYVPVCQGGALRDFEELFSLVRAIARRDVTVAVSHAVSFLGAVGVWVAGERKQQTGLAARLLGGERISLALTERDHGGDLLSLETKAYLREDGLRWLHGGKWLINGASRNSLVSVLARTSVAGGPRGFSLFLFDKAAARSGSFECLQKVRTLGVRGADISGICFHGAALGPSTMIGSCGEGFEIILKGLQLSRLLCGAISLGAAETAFETTLQFALERRVYGGTVYDIPQCRRLLAEAWADLLLCDAVLAAAARSLHFAPQEASVHSAVVKYLVPSILEHTLKQLSVILGARYYLRGEHHSGIFQKMLRDSLLVSLFDGSSILNLYLLTTQFQALSRSGKAMVGRDAESLASLACPANLLPEFDWSRLSLTCGGKNFFIDRLPAALEAARSLERRLPKNVSPALQAQLNALSMAAGNVKGGIGAIYPGSPHAIRSESFETAAGYCALEGAAMILQMWLAHRTRTGTHWADGQWLELALSRLNACLGQKTKPNDALIAELAEIMIHRQASPANDERSELSSAGFSAKDFHQTHFRKEQCTSPPIS
jgi:alkylation response protein AidB-like acyl-CoA dehydrogenase